MMRNPKIQIQILWGSHRVCVKNIPCLPTLRASFPLDNGTMASLPSSVTTGFGFKKASNVDCKLRFRGTFAAIVGCVGCAGVWGCGDMGVTSGDSGDLGDSTATDSSLES